jgi:hypothetical protein
MGEFFFLALMTLGIGLAFARFQNWSREVGIVFTSAAGFIAFEVLTIVCMFQSSEYKEFFPDIKMDFFSDYVSGISCTAVFAIVGILLIKNSRMRAEQAVDPDQ